MNTEQIALFNITRFIQQNNLTEQAAIDLIKNNSDLAAFMELRRIISENSLTEEKTEELIKKACLNLADQLTSPDIGEDRES